MVANSAEVKLRSFSTKVHKVRPRVTEALARLPVRRCGAYRGQHVSVVLLLRIAKCAG